MEYPQNKIVIAILIAFVGALFFIKWMLNNEPTFSPDKSLEADIYSYSEKLKHEKNDTLPFSFIKLTNDFYWDNLLVIAPNLSTHALIIKDYGVVSDVNFLNDPKLSIYLKNNYLLVFLDGNIIQRYTTINKHKIEFNVDRWAFYSVLNIVFYHVTTKKSVASIYSVDRYTQEILVKNASASDMQKYNDSISKNNPFVKVRTLPNGQIMLVPLDSTNKDEKARIDSFKKNGTIGFWELN